MSETPTQPVTRVRRTQFGWYALAIFAVALLARGAYTWQLHDRELLGLLIGESRTYDRWGDQIASNALGDEVFPRAPLYPYLLGLIYALFDGDLLAAQVYHILLSSLSCVFVGQAGWRLFSTPVGFAAGLLMALCGPALFLDGMIGPSVLEVFLICLLIWLFAELTRRPHKLLYAAAGLVLGCLILTRDTMVVLLPVLLAWPIVRHRRRMGQGLAFAGLMGLAAIVVVTPALVRNRVVAGHLRLTGPLFGPRFFVGNHAGASGHYEPLLDESGTPNEDYLSPTELAEQGVGHPLTPGEVSRYWFARAWKDVSTKPGDWLRLLARKCALAWEATEVSEPPDQYTYADVLPVLRWITRLVSFGTLAPAAILGLCITWRHRRRLWPLYAMVIALTLSQAFLFVSSRGRYPLVPILTLLAGAGVVGIWRFARTRSPIRTAGCITAVAALAVGINRPLTPLAPMQAKTHLELGMAMADFNDLQSAFRHCERALELDPDLSRVYLVLGNLYAAVDYFDEAIEHYRIAGSDLADSPELHYRFAMALSQANQNDRALGHYRDAIRLKPDWESPFNNAAWLLATHPEYAGRHNEEAIRLAEQACELTEYKDAMLVDTLAAAYATAGRFDEAVAMMEAGMELPSARQSVALFMEMKARLDMFREGKIYYEPTTQPETQPETAPATSVAPDSNH